MGNVLADQITTISTSLEAEVSVNNPLPTSGGTDIVISAPNSSDRRLLSRDLSFSLKGLASEEIRALLSQNDILLTPDLEELEIIEEIFTPEEGAPGIELDLKKKVRFLALYVSEEDLLSLAADLVKAQYQEDDYEPLLESITISQLSSPIPRAAGSFTWRMEVTWNEQKSLDHNEILQMILGKKPLDAKVLLQKNLELEVPPRIKLSPSWWLRIPALPFRISINEGEK